MIRRDRPGGAAGGGGKVLARSSSLEGSTISDTIRGEGGIDGAGGDSASSRRDGAGGQVCVGGFEEAVSI